MSQASPCSPQLSSSEGIVDGGRTNGGGITVFPDNLHAVKTVEGIMDNWEDDSEVIKWMLDRYYFSDTVENNNSDAD
jgi:hypothetical protein